MGQPYCICIEEVDFDLKGSETDAAGKYIAKESEQKPRRLLISSPVINFKQGKLIKCLADKAFT